MGSVFLLEEETRVDEVAVATPESIPAWNEPSVLELTPSTPSFAYQALTFDMDLAPLSESSLQDARAMRRGASSSARGGGWSLPEGNESTWSIERPTEPSTPDFESMLDGLKKEGLDVVILFDSTQSMAGEIAQVKRQIGEMGSVLFKLVPGTRLGVCAYRDRGDAYLVKGQPLSDDLGSIVGFISSIEAAGGGDETEAVDEGMRWVLANNQFRPAARKVLLIFGDAPAHPSAQADCLDLAIQFRRQGGLVSTVTCRREQPMDEFRDVAQVGGGEAFLTSDHKQIVARLMVLIFGSRHQAAVVKAFQLLDE